MKKSVEKTKSSKKEALLCLGLACLVLMVGLGVRVAQAAWEEPSAQAPEGNKYAPINVGLDSQTKKGGLLLNPLYNPWGELPDSNYQLEVLGQGASFSNLKATSSLTVDTDTLYVDSNGVGVGTTSPAADLQIVGGKLNVNSSVVSSPAISVISSANYGLSGTSQGANLAGVYGYSASGYGVYGNNGFGGYGVVGASDSASAVVASTAATYNPYNIIAGIYGRATGLNAWAGYFEQQLYGSDQIIGRKFVPNRLQYSQIPYTAGWKVRDVTDSTGLQPTDMVFEGTYIWTANPTINNISKFRASDGVKISDYAVAGGPQQITFDGTNLWTSNSTTLTSIDPISGSIGATYNINLGNDLLFDGTYLWLTRSSSSNNLIKINRATGAQSGPYTVGNNPSQMVFDGTYIWTVNTTSKTLSKVLASSGAVTEPAFNFATLNNLTPQSIIFDGTYLWIGTTAADGDGNNIFKILAASGELAGKYNLGTNSLGTNLSNVRSLAFDGTFVWAASGPVDSNGYLSRIVAATGQVIDAVPYGNCSGAGNMLFDGNHIWLADQNCSGTPALHQFYSGSGRGLLDLAGSATLYQTLPSTAQAGSFSIDGAAIFGVNLTVVADLVVPNNTWGGALDNERALSTGCDNGEFAKGVNLTTDVLLCRPL